MNAQWRLFLEALGWVTQSIPAQGASGGAPPPQASRFVPVVGIYIGLVAAVVYWATAQIWPTSVAVVLSMLAATLMTTRNPPRPDLGAAYWVFVLFIKYNALMALSSANVPLPLPAYCGLGLIMIAAQTASRGLVVSFIASDSLAAPRGAPAQECTPVAKPATLPPVTAGDLVIALTLGLAPAALLGIPGLIGLVAAIVMRLGLTAYALRKFSFASRERLEVVQQLTELSFYLGALASWKYV